MLRRRFKAPRLATVIGEGTELCGDLHFSGGLHLDGKVIGNVKGKAQTEATLTVSEKGSIEGDVRVDTLILNGCVNGDVYAAQRVELAPQARVTGTVYYCSLEMAMGAEVNGQLIHNDDQAQFPAEQGAPG